MIDNPVIPDFPLSRILELSDKQQLDTIFEALQPLVSEFTFAGLYLFRDPHEYRLTRVGDAVVVLGKGYDGEPYFLPPFSGNISNALSVLFGMGLTLYGADERFADSFLSDAGLALTEDRDSFDYLYLRNELAELPGNRFHKKKNRVNYFSARHSFNVEIFGAPHIQGCIDLLTEWQRIRVGEGDGSGAAEADSTREALQLACQLGLEGVVVLVEGSVKGFALGERLNRQTSVCHFEKADPFMEGLSQLLDREFNRLLFTDCAYVNREQDLGEPGLRAAKLSYHPVELVKKIRACAIPGL